MAELYAEQERYYSFRARDLDEKVFDAQQKNDAAKANQLKAQQTDFEKREKQWLLEAVKKYIEVANGPKYQSYSKMDQVLFYLAYLLTQATLIVAALMQRYDLRLDPARPVQIETSMTLRPKGGLWMTLHSAPSRTTSVERSRAPETAGIAESLNRYVSHSVEAGGG